jgi:Fe-S-cluster containining protein
MTPPPWYAAGLRFTCTRCGNCCTGPPGYVWCTPAEAQAIAAHLKLDPPEFLDRYTRALNGRRSLCEIESVHGYDCVFLRRGADGAVGCAIYPVRPEQCRTWPFWPENLAGPHNWRRAAGRCPGLAAGLEDRGKFYPLTQIRTADPRRASPAADPACSSRAKLESDKTPCRVWRAAAGRPEVDAALRNLWADLEARVQAHGALCAASGRCCRFDRYGHRLYATGLEIAWLLAHLPPGQQTAWPARLTPRGDCPFQNRLRCAVHPNRALGCRIFFCRPDTQDWQHEVYEEFLAALRRLHERFDLPYRYLEWRAGLAEALTDPE